MTSRSGSSTTASGFSSVGAFGVASGIGNEPWRSSFVGKIETAQVREAQNFCHLRVIDFLRGVRSVVIVRVKSSEPPERRNILQHKRKLVAAEENVERRLMVEAVIKRQADVRVFGDDGAVVIRTVERSDEIQAVAGVGRNVDESLGLVAGSFVAAYHVEIDHGAGGFKRPQRMRGKIKCAEQAALFGCEYHKQNGTLRCCGGFPFGVGGEGVSKR